MAINGSGGGISLQQSSLKIKGNCNIVNNYAQKGGGIHASSSSIAVYQPGRLKILNNSAGNGGGMYLEVNPKLYVLKTQAPDFRNFGVNGKLLTFSGNRADYGGAVYMADDTNSGTCSPNFVCFIQTLALHQAQHVPLNMRNIAFSENNAS